jgi:Ankyrin repeats (3 copies)/Ankyrin repeat
VFCQLEVLRQCFPPSVRRILEELPDTLDETYERILREIRKPNQGHAHKLLQCLVAAVRPLQVKELAEVLAFDFKAEGIPKLNPGWRWEDQEEAVMSACSSLVIIVKDGDSRIVQFSHFSVKEFLTANRLAEPIRDVSRYHTRLKAAHTILAQACLGVLLRLDDHVDRDKIENFPLARYAAQHWATHARFENISSRIKDGMECLFDAGKPHFATWVWIYDENPTEHPGKPSAVPLYYAAKLGFCDLAEHLIAEHPEHVNAKGGSERTPMHVAASSGHAGVLSLLLEHGANLDGRGISDQTPLHRASWCGNVEAVQCLLGRGADINAGDNTNWTPLHCAVKGREIQAVRLLLEHGADVNARSKSGKAPSQLSSALSRPDIMELLTEYGAKSVQ